MIVITTPTGQIGHQVLENLVDSDEEPPRHRTEASLLSDEVRDRVEVVEGSHSDASVVHRAFAGADAVFWLVPPDPQAPRSRLLSSTSPGLPPKTCKVQRRTRRWCDGARPGQRHGLTRPATSPVPWPWTT